jgi:predicted DNA-binding transcriptional regulator YafY/DNA gyrase inhibitor GyrI
LRIILQVTNSQFSILNYALKKVNRLDRISAILVWLQSRSVVRAADCAERFGVSVRTIYRDIRTLEQAGVPICGDAGVGYSLVDGYRLPPLMFTPQEALAFLTAEKFMESLADSHHSRHFHSGMDKVRAVMRGVQRDYMSVLADAISVYRSRQTPTAKMPNLQQTILGSIAGREILEMGYTRADGTISRREVEAVGIAFVNPYWYLAAWCHLRGEYRTFRLDRIDTLLPTGRPHTIAAHPPLNELMKYENLKNQNTMKINSIEIQEVEPIKVIALTHIGEYSGIGGAFSRLGGWAGANNYWAKEPRMIGIYHDDPSSVAPEKLRSSACLEEMPGLEPGEGMSRYAVSGGKYLVMNAEVTMAEYGAAWQKIYAEIGTRGLVCDGRDHYELYISCVDSTQGYDAPWIVEFRVPVK